MVLDNRVEAISKLRAALTVPLSSIQYAVSIPIKIVDKINNTISTHDALIKENLDLKKEQFKLRVQVQRLMAIELENQQLKALTRSSDKIDGNILLAQLLSVSTDPFVNQVVLNKGSRSAVYVGQPVLDSNGVMGQVMQVGPNTSRVLLINDTKSGVPVQVIRNGIRAVAVGDTYSGRLRLINVPQTADIVKDDVLVTSGLGIYYPEGYPVGKVLAVSKNLGLPFLVIEIEPFANLDRARDVMLVWPRDKSRKNSG